MLESKSSWQPRHYTSALQAAQHYRQQAHQNQTRLVGNQSYKAITTAIKYKTEHCKHCWDKMLNIINNGSHLYCIYTDISIQKLCATKIKFLEQIQVLQFLAGHYLANGFSCLLFIYVYSKMRRDIVNRECI